MKGLSYMHVPGESIVAIDYLKPSLSRICRKITTKLTVSWVIEYHLRQKDGSNRIIATSGEKFSIHDAKRKAGELYAQYEQRMVNESRWDKSYRAKQRRLEREANNT